MNDKPLIAVCTLVFNAESTLPPGMWRKWLEQANQVGDLVIIVEGATKAVTGYWDGDTSGMTNNGSSTDMTLPVVYNYMDSLSEAEKNKFIIIPAKGFWDGKTKMCNRWSYELDMMRTERPIYLWHMDSDEFYHEEQIPKIKELLHSELPDAVFFYAWHFFGDMGHVTTAMTGDPNLGLSKRWGNGLEWRRIWRHYPGCRWDRHEPPVYLLPDGKSMMEGKIINEQRTLELNLRMFHYSYVWRPQAKFKADFFRNPDVMERFDAWKKDHKEHALNSAKVRPYVYSHPELIHELICKHGIAP